MSTFPKMTELVRPATVGYATVEHYTITPFDAMRDSFKGIYTEPGKVAILRVNGRTMMSDTQHERRSNRQFVAEARGHVLVAGLGLGMVLHPILAKTEVLSLTVIEKHQDVIDLIKPTLPAAKHVTIICADIFAWQPPKGDKWETVYFDIWADLCTDNLTQIAALHQRFKAHKVAGGWMGSWCQDELRYRKRQGQ